MKDRALVLGAGNSRLVKVRLHEPDSPFAQDEEVTFDQLFKEVVTVDMDGGTDPTYCFDMDQYIANGDWLSMSWPVDGKLGLFDEIHAYEVLEHLGEVGNAPQFFALWRKLWGLLKEGGRVCVSTPWWESVWAWQDPGHRRVYSMELLTYLNQDEYVAQVGRTPMTDYRALFPPPYHFDGVVGAMWGADPKAAGFRFILQKRSWKPDDQG